MDLHQHVNVPIVKNLSDCFQQELKLESSDQSFAEKLLISVQKDKFINGLKSISKEVVLYAKINTPESSEEPGRVNIFRVNVYRDKGKQVVRMQEPSVWSTFLQSNKDHEVRIILIRSDSVPVIDAKLHVYNEFRNIIEKSEIYLHHEFEDYEEIAKMSARNKIAGFGSMVKTLSKSIPIENLDSIINEAADRALTQENVRQLCFGVDIKDDGKSIGTVNSSSYVCFSTFTVRRLKKYLAQETLQKVGESLGSEICTGILRYIESKVKAELKGDLIHLELELTNEIFATFTIIVMAVLSFYFTSWFTLIMMVGSMVVVAVLTVDVNSVEWRRKVADEIYNKVRDKRSNILRKVTPEIKALCQNTSKDLGTVAEKILKIRDRIQLIDKIEMIELWKKREVLENEAKLESHPSFLQYIAGNDWLGMPIVKMFYRDDNTDDNFQSFCKSCCKKTLNTKFTFVPVAVKSPREVEESSMKKGEEKKAAILNKSVRKELTDIIEEQQERVYALYSNVIGIGISQVKLDGNTTQEGPCIVLYCLDKNIIPFGEESLPRYLGKWPCDIREDFVMLGRCPRMCPATNIGHPEPGCSIGIAQKSSSGSVGFLVEFSNPLETGFLTASHVVVEKFKEMYSSNITLPNPQFQSGNHHIVHPSFLDLGNTYIGEVVQSFFGNFESSVALDLAVVKNRSIRGGEKEILTVVNSDALIFEEEMKVIKTGNTSGTTEGILKGNILSVKVKEFIFKNVFSVEDTGNRRFFEEGDSGSGVFLVKNNKCIPLGIAFAFMGRQTLVCRIDKIVEKLNLAVVRYV